MAMADPDTEEDYWLALGEFIDTFSHAEQMMHSFLKHRAKVSREVGNSIFAGTRIDAAISFIKRIHTAETGEEKIPADLEEIFNQLAAINSARNDIVHFGAINIGEDYLLLTNIMKAHSDKALRLYPIKAETLRAMTVDTDKIIMALYAQTLDREERAKIEASSDLKTPWQYKAPQPLEELKTRFSVSVRNNSPETTDPQKPSRK